MFPKHSEYARIFESFALDLIISVPLTINNYLLHYNVNLNKILFFFSVKLIEYIFSALRVVSNPCVGPIPRIKMSFFLLSIFVDELISTPKIITFLPISLPIENKVFLSNPIPYPEYPYLSISSFLVNPHMHEIFLQLYCMK